MLPSSEAVCCCSQLESLKNFERVLMMHSWQRVTDWVQEWPCWPELNTKQRHSPQAVCVCSHGPIYSLNTPWILRRERFTVHGLWKNFDTGRWPSFCSHERFDAAQLAPLRPALDAQWPSYYGPSEKFWVRCCPLLTPLHPSPARASFSYPIVFELSD